MRRTHAVLAAVLALTACATPPPSQPENACAIFRERKGWWDAVRDSEKRWGAPPGVILAILNQESGFTHDARPPRKKALFVIPTPFRQSSSYGYAQATKPTWEQYKDDTGRGGADRDSFRDAADFVGWYAHRSRKLSGIALDDARGQYIAYNVGHGAYNKGAYSRRVARAADQVGARAARYERQLATCRKDLDRKFLFIF